MNHKRENCPLSQGIDLFNSEGAINIQKLMAYEDSESHNNEKEGHKLDFHEEFQILKEEND